MFRWTAILLAVAAGALLASCATLSEDQCQVGDWRAVGLADGIKGRPASALSRHVDACSQYGIGIDRAVYQAGRAEGLAAYCRPEIAAAEGLAGQAYFGVCEGDLGVAFARIHRAGEAVYDLEVERNSIESEIGSLVRRMAQPGLTDPERADLARQIRALERERDSVRRQIRLAERRLSLIKTEEQLRLSGAGA